MEAADQHFNIVLLGAPGSGKGTQARLIQKKYGLTHLSTGALFRQEIARRTEIGLQAEKVISQGNYCTDDLTLNMLNKYIAQAEPTPGFIFDGVPRTLEQAEKMDGLQYAPSVPVSCVLFLFIDDEEIVKRILQRACEENREDDKDAAVIRQRILNYHHLTEPLTRYYREQGKLVVVDGMHSIDEVFHDIDKVLAPRMKTRP